MTTPHTAADTLPSANDVAKASFEALCGRPHPWEGAQPWVLAAMHAYALQAADKREAEVRTEAMRWREAIINELVIAHIYSKEHDDNPRKAIQDAISWNCAVALDPAVSSDAQALVEKGRAGMEKDAMRAEQALRKVLDVVRRFLPPDGPSIGDAMNEIIEIVDPWPLESKP